MSPRRHSRSTRAAIGGGLIVGLIASMAACSSDAAKTAPFSVPHVYDLNVDPAQGIAPVDPNRGQVVTAEQLRNLLDQQLAWHGLTLVEVMRAARADRAEVQVWIDQLTQNTADLTATVGLAYGPVAARAFNQQWAQHTQFLVDYAVAIGQDDKKAAADARAELVDYAHDSGSFFSTATGGILPVTAVQDLLSTHVGHMLTMIEADQAGDVAGTVDAAVTDSAYLSTIANGLSTAIAQQNQTAFPGTTDTPLAALCSLVTSGTGSYLSSLIITGDPASSQVLNADQALVSATGATTAAIIGLSPNFGGTDSTARAEAAKAALATANAFALAHPPAPAP
ncbi:MAG: copper amine oxidase [Ilumatobacteraceae bacterium]|nr:copper amine oxidase [Ilumatobacteraceae bacterium]MCU1386676.1 copper amine oxidase [Ilumatobacteraceae bacterium]